MAQRQNSTLGKTGENVALSYLQEKGWTLVERNWYCSAGEIDLVMRDGTEIVFVEVKTRVSELAGAAEEAVTRGKAKRALSAGDWYVSKHDAVQGLIWRLDLVAVTMGRNGAILRVTHIENAIVSG